MMAKTQTTERQMSLTYTVRRVGKTPAGLAHPDQAEATWYWLVLDGAYVNAIRVVELDPQLDQGPQFQASWPDLKLGSVVAHDADSAVDALVKDIIAKPRIGKVPTSK